jgi:hypothetical protein
MNPNDIMTNNIQAIGGYVDRSALKDPNKTHKELVRRCVRMKQLQEESPNNSDALQEAYDEIVGVAQFDAAYRACPPYTNNEGSVNSGQQPTSAASSASIDGQSQQTTDSNKA